MTCNQFLRFKMKMIIFILNVWSVLVLIMGIGKKRKSVQSVFLIKNVYGEKYDEIKRTV